ncbi:unnamed protein product [Protopolystoma xenopodis]|uniref:Uncharacterized protein n=1 Tax=Protopolystoma xenopodis TaxID=117903 RepID=A0A3S4ZQP3_9PLAT|nr:unnamed protein product [Protopolystoma xenopodis]
MLPVDVVAEVTTPIDQHDDRKKVANLSSFPLEPETTTILKKRLNSSLQDYIIFLGDILVEVINISEKFPKGKKREVRMKLIPKILTHQEPTHRNRVSRIRKILETISPSDG